MIQIGVIGVGDMGGRHAQVSALDGQGYTESYFSSEPFSPHMQQL